MNEQKVFREDVEINAILWLHSLREEDKGLTNKIIEDLEPLCVLNKIYFQEFKIENQEDLIYILKEIKEKCQKDGLRPIIHFDAHGDKDEGMLIVNSNELVKWNIIFDCLSEINKSTKNNTVVLFALCYGLELYKLCSIHKPSPAYSFIASDDVLNYGFIMDNMFCFYKELVNTKNISKSYGDNLKSNMKEINCQVLLAKSFKIYILNFDTEEKIINKAEFIVKKQIENGTIKYFETEKINKSIKSAADTLRPSQKILDVLSKTFLCGRSAAFKLEDIY